MGSTNWKTNQLLYINGSKLSDHNRAELSVSTEDINNRERMADGTMRGYTIAVKHTWSTSWENLPSKAHAQHGPVDSGLSGEDLHEYYLNNRQPVMLTVQDGAGNSETFLALMTEFDYAVSKRGASIDLWNVSITLEEV